MNALLKRVLTIALSTAMLISTLTFGGANVVMAEGYVEKEIVATETYNDPIAITQATLEEVDGVYSVGSVDDWNALVEKNSDYAGKTVVLTEDIEFTNANATLATFAGKLDGNGNTLTGVKNPLIATLNGGATIQNLIVEDAVVNVSGTNSTGLIAQTVNVTAAINLSDIAVKNANVTSTTAGVSGMLGNLKTGSSTITFTNCTVSGTIKGKYLASGFIVETPGSGCSFTLTMDNCKNSADLGTTVAAPGSNPYVAGMAAYLGRTLTVVMTDCENAGNINVDVTLGKTTLDIYAAGYIGRIRSSFTMQNCRNTGNISVKESSLARNAYMGGFVGHVGDGATTTVLAGCVNSGNMVNVSGSLIYEFMGGMIGYCAQDTSITGCVNYGDITANGTSATATNTPFSGCAAGIVCMFTTGSKLTVTDTYNMGTIYSADAFAGGILAQVRKPVELSGCVNTGDIYSHVNVESNTYLADAAARHVAGGIVAGPYHNNATGSTITDCINTGKVMGANSAAGILGSVQFTSTFALTDCSNSGAILSAGSTGGIIGNTAAAVTVSACYATGAYVSTGANLGAIAGNAANVTVADSYASVTLNDVYTAWEGAAKSEKKEAEMISALAVLNLEAQKSAVADGKFDVVALAGMNKLSYLTQVGFEVIRVVDGKIATLSTEGTNVYTDVYGYDADGNKVKVNATDYENVKYLSALKITNVSTEENVTYLYRAFAVKTVEGVDTTLYGTWSAVTFAPVAE